MLTVYDTTPFGLQQPLRASNGIFYTSPKFGGVTVRANYGAGAESFGGVAAAPKQHQTQYGISAEYGAGPLTLAAAYQEIRLANATVAGGVTAFTGGTSTERDAIIGAKYNFGAFSVGGGAAQIDPVDSGPAGTGNKARTYWLGGTVGLGKGTLLAQVSTFRGDQGAYLGGQSAATGPRPRANIFGVAYTYPFSRRTTGYVAVGATNNNASAAMPLRGAANSVGGAVFNADPRGIAVGVRHTF